MGDTLSNVSGTLLAEKAVGGVLDYTLDYASGMDAGETLVNSIWTATPADPSISLTSPSFTATSASITVVGGTPGTWYVISNLATGDNGLVHDASFSLWVFDPTALGANLDLPFPSVAGALAALRRDRLMIIAQNFFPGISIDNAYLLDKLAAATAFVSHKLRVFLTQREMLPNTASQDEIDALTLAGNTVNLEPAYDYDPSFFQGNTWGFMPLRQRPIIAVHSMQFQYPTPNNTLWTIPPEWIRADKKYGTINLLPVTGAMTMPLNAFILSALGGGRMVPHFLAIRYRAGLENVARDWPDILDVILKQTVLSIIEDCYIPSSRSESVSADGLSQSSSLGLKISDYADVIDRKLETIRSALFGIMLGVV
jgi:hypothetical protein